MSRFPFRAPLLTAAVCALAPFLMAGAVSSAAQAADTPAPAAAEAAKAAAPVDPVVGRVNGEDIHRSELEALLPQLPPQVRQMPFEALFDALLDQVVNQKLILAAGYAAGHQNDESVKAAVKTAEGQAVQRAFLSKRLDERITPEALDEAYKEFLAAQPAEEEVKAAHILVATEAEAVAIIAALKKGGDFAKLASEKSIDKAAGEQGGDLGYFTKDLMVGPFAEAAFAMKPGEVSAKPVQTQFGWHVIKVEDRRTKAPPTREAADKQLRQQLAEELVTGMLTDLRAHADVALFNVDGSKRAEAPAAEAPKK